MSEEEQLTDAEKMRLKRLARLGNLSGSRTPDAGGGENSSLNGAPEISTLGKSQNGPSPSRSPVDPTSFQSNKASPAIAAETSNSKSRLSSAMQRNEKPSTGTPSKMSITPAQATASSSRLPARPVSGGLAISHADYEEWEAAQVSEILGVTLINTDDNRCWLKDLKSELEEENVSLRTTVDISDRLLIARLSMDTPVMSQSDDPDKLAIVASLPLEETVLEYLIGCWKRLYRANRNTTQKALSDLDRNHWKAVYEKLKQLLMSYCAMTLEDPTMFPQPQNRLAGPAEFLPILLSTAGTSSNLSSTDPLTGAGPSQSRGQTHHTLSSTDIVPFLNDLAAAAEDTMSEVLIPTLSLFFQEWFKISPSPDLMGTEWQQYLGAMSILVQVKPIATVLPSLPLWVAPNVDAPKLEWQSLLGPLIRLSVYPREYPQIWKTYFAIPEERKTDDIDANKSNLRHTLNSLQTHLSGIFAAIVRGSPSSRENILDYMALIVKLNARRAGMRVDSRTVSSDGFMTNIQVILLRLLEPAMDTRFTKIDKVDVDYFRGTSRINIDEETKIRSTQEESKAYFEQVTVNDHGTSSGSNPFISDVFFLSNAIHHLALAKTISTRMRANKNISEIEKELKRAEASRGDWGGNPALQAQGEASIKKLKSDIEVLKASVHAYDTQLLEPGLVRLTTTFLNFVMTWLVRLVDPRHLHPQRSIELPLPSEAPLNFRTLPEYFIENIAEYFDFIFAHSVDFLDSADKDILITFALTFISPGYVNNPFLKAKLVSIIALGLYPAGHYRKGALYDNLVVHSIATRHLMPTIIGFFIEVENTGGHTQFWDKFNFRRDMSRIFRSLWDNPVYRESFIKAGSDDSDEFIKFVNMLMSDTTFHLEESLSSLSKINSIQTLKADSQAWAAMTDEERTDNESQLRSAESQAPFHTVMGLDHIELMKEFTATTTKPFVTPEIVDRLAAALDENLVNLVGPKMQELRVPDPDRFAFKPKRLLAGIAQVYLNLRQEPDFVRAVANDGRSYTKQVFEKFARILKHRAIIPEVEVAEVVAFTQRVEDTLATIKIEDEREIPDDFLDPLLSTLMKDPVILPVSRVVVDRGTIRTVLLSKEQDPFNNMPLKLEDCIPDTELKARIDEWLAAGKAAPANDVMDVDEL